MIISDDAKRQQMLMHHIQELGQARKEKVERQREHLERLQQERALEEDAKRWLESSLSSSRKSGALPLPWGPGVGDCDRCKSLRRWSLDPYGMRALTDLEHVIVGIRY